MVKQINNTKNYFIHSDGYVFRIINGKEVIINLNIIRGIPKVKINNQRLNIVLLMIEYFSEINDINIKYSFKILDGKVPLKHISVKRLKGEESDDDKKIFLYKCKEKASASNSRVSFTSTITEIDVLNCLKRSNYRCFYCDCQLSTKHWHLDHVIPLSKGGLNYPTNIVSSCKNCNLMKGALGMDKFLFMVDKIYQNNIEKIEQIRIGKFN